MEANAPTLQNSLTAAGSKPQVGSVSSEIAEAQSATSVLHGLISELENRLGEVTHKFNDFAQELGADTPEPARTALAHEAHVVVTDVYGAQARIRNLLDTLGL